MYRALLVIGVVGVVVAGGIFLVSHEGEGNNNWGEWMTELPEGNFDVSQEEAEAAQQAVEESYTQGSELETYRDASGRFSFAYPPAYSVGAFDTGEQHTVLLQNNEQGVGLQILASPFDEDIVLTEARIRQDLPGLDMRNVRRVRVDGIPALLFASSGSDFGQSIELWFVHRGFLYQLTTYAHLASLMDRVANSLQFP